MIAALRTLPQTLRTWCRNCLEPPSHITDAETRTRARLIIEIIVWLGMIGVFISVVGGIAAVLILGTLQQTLAFISASAIGGGTMYLLARRGWHETALRSYLAALMFLIHLAAIPRPPGEVGNLIFHTVAVIPLLITALLLPTRSVVFLLAVHLVMVAFVVVNTVPHLFPLLVLGSGALKLVIAVLALRWQRYQHTIERLRRQTLAAQNATFQIIERYSDEVVMILNSDLTLRHVSANAERVIGADASTMIGASFIQKSWTQFMTPETTQSTLAAGAARLLSGQDTQSVTAYQRPDGRRLWLETTASVIPAKPGASPGSIDGVVLMMRDVTARKEAEDALQRERNLLRTLIDSLPDYVYVLDIHGQMLLQNAAAVSLFQRMTKLPATASTVERWKRDLDPDYVQRVEADNARVLAGEQILEREAELPLSDGSLLPVATSKIPLRDKDGTIIGMIGRTRDISAQKAAQAAAVAQAQEQERLTLALRQEQEMNGLKTLFMTLISHEFRTPLAKMQTALDLLERYADRLSPAARAERFRTVGDQIGVLKVMLEDITTVLELQTRAAVLNPELTHLPTFCQQLIDELHSAAYQRPVRLLTSGQMHGLLLDRRMLRYILRNLLSNAFKYSPEDMPVTLELHYQTAPDTATDHLLLRVTDRGIGLTPEDLRHLFQPFYRGEHVQNISGTGLGLKIVHDCVTLLGGTITATGAPGTGAQFTVTLPIARAPLSMLRAAK